MSIVTAHPVDWPLWLPIQFLLLVPAPLFPAGPLCVCCFQGRSTKPVPKKAQKRPKTKWLIWLSQWRLCRLFPNLKKQSVLRKTHSWPHHCSEWINRLIYDNVLSYVVVDVFVRAAYDAWSPVPPYACLVQMLLLCRDQQTSAVTWLPNTRCKILNQKLDMGKYKECMQLVLHNWNDK